MKDLKTNIALIAGILSLALATTSIVQNSTKEQIAYVRSTELVYGYIGMKEAQNRYQEKTEIWQANVDTLQKEFQLAVSRYTAEVTSLSDDDKERRKKALTVQQENLVGYSQALNDKAKEEDEKITQSVLNQINSFVEEYGAENGYEVILGTTLSGSLLYGDDAIDITEEVLDALNSEYLGEE